MVQEPSFTLQNAAIWVVPYVAYFIGICIRKVALASPGSPRLLDQLLLGLPTSLVIVSPFVVVLRAAMGADVPAYLFNLGLIIEHGMIVQETATQQLQRLVGGQKPPGVGLVPAAGSPAGG